MIYNVTMNNNIVLYTSEGLAVL